MSTARSRWRSAPSEARELVELAVTRGLRLGCSPSTILGEAQQTAAAWIRAGRLGPVRAIYADVSWGRIETWHPAPAPFYEVGAMVDVAVYPLTLATAMIGPARSVRAWGWELSPDRVTLDGAPFRIGSPDFIVATVELEGGAVLRLTASFYVGPTGEGARRDGVPRGRRLARAWQLPGVRRDGGGRADTAGPTRRSRTSGRRSRAPPGRAASPTWRRRSTKTGRIEPARIRRPTWSTSSRRPPHPWRPMVAPSRSTRRSRRQQPCRGPWFRRPVDERPRRVRNDQRRLARRPRSGGLP